MSGKTTGIRLWQNGKYAVRPLRTNIRRSVGQTGAEKAVLSCPGRRRHQEAVYRLIMESIGSTLGYRPENQYGKTAGSGNEKPVIRIRRYAVILRGLIFTGLGFPMRFYARTFYIPDLEAGLVRRHNSRSISF
jgi:hypothetical protein